MKKIIILLLVLPFVSQVLAEKVIIQEGKGIAPKREDAIKKAIFEAVAKAKGINVGSGKYEYSYESASADIEKTNTGGKEIGFDAVSIYAEGTTANTATKALVKTFEVLDEKKLPDGSYEVKLKVWIYDYENPDKTSRLKIAVMPPTTPDSNYTFGDIKISDKELSRKITHILNVKLAAANKFSILDRGHIDKVMEEKGLIWLGDASLEEKAKIGNLLGADYILTSTVTEAQLTVKEKYLESVGRKTYEHEAKFKLDYSLINAATSQIKLADSVRLYLEDRDVRKLVPKWRDDKIDYLVLAEEIIKSATSPIADRIAGGLYPARIAKILPDNVVVINKGGQDVLVSDIYDVLKQGDELFDYDTKESLGKIEEPIGAIKITKVMSNFSYAALIEGDISKISEGFICRKKGQEAGKPIEQQSDTQLTPSGGVKMPFDK